MAEKRMFASSVVSSDPFLDMPAEAQALYFQLCMAADDDGFCDSPRKIMRACGASNDSMKILVSKKFVLTFEKGDNFIVVIKHWRLNNYIRKDSYHETKYKELMRELYYDENKSYSMNPGDGHVPCVEGALPEAVTAPSQSCDEPVTDTSQERDEPSTQNRIEKNSIEKFSREIDKNRKEECEGKTTEAPKPEEFIFQPKPGRLPILSAEERKARIKFWKGRVDFMKQNKYSTECMYSVALAEEGITKEDIDNFRED